MAEKRKARQKGNLKSRAFGRAADAFGKEIVPAGREAGAVALRVSGLLLRAVDASISGIEHAGVWVQQAVRERLAGVKPEKVVPPDARIAVPVLQALVSSLDDEVIRDMFANLLANDMNADTKSFVHPSFVELIKEMAQLEARIFHNLHKIGGLFKLTFKSAKIPMGRFDTAAGKISYVHSFVRYSFPNLGYDEGFVALSNLLRLGLVDIVMPIKMAKNGIGSSGSAELMMTPLGQRFAQVCLPPKPDWK
jgi:hypothetical protein